MGHIFGSKKRERERTASTINPAFSGDKQLFLIPRTVEILFGVLIERTLFHVKKSIVTNFLIHKND